MSSVFLKKFFERNQLSVPKLHIVLGSGLAPVFDSCIDRQKWTPSAELTFGELPGFVPASVPGHKGLLRYFINQQSGQSVCFQVGRLHGYEGHEPQRVVRPLVSACLAGTQKFLLTNAAGALNPNFEVGGVMIIDDHVNMTGMNPLYGPNPVGEDGKALGPRFPDMSQAYSKRMKKSLLPLLKAQGVPTFEGVYLGLLGPSFETPAEVKLFSSWGMGSVGMSTVWESIALNHMGAEVGGLSFLSNMGCGLVSEEKLRHEDVEAQAQKSAPKLLQAIFDFAHEETL